MSEKHELKIKSLEERLVLLESVLKQTVECLNTFTHAIRRNDVPWSLSETCEELSKRVESW